MLQTLKRLLALFRRWRNDRPPRREADPHAWRPVPRKPKPNPRSAAVAVAEPDE
jgi:hypothetical protein